MSVPDRIDPTALLGAMGAIAERGTFALTLFGKHGVVDVGGDAIRIRGRASPVIATISGDFQIDERGQIQVRFEGRTNVKEVDSHVAGEAQLQVGKGELSGTASLRGRARPTKPIEIEMPIEISVDDSKVGAKVGNLEVSHDRERMAARSGRRWFGIEKSVERTMLLSIGDRTTISLDRDAILSGDLSFHLGPSGLSLSSNGVNARFDLAGTQVDNEQLALRLGEGSVLECSVSNVSIDERGGLRLDDLEAGFQVRIEGGRFDHSLLGAALDAGKLNALEGTIALKRDEQGASLDSRASVTVHALPRIAGLFGLGVEKTGTLQARITRDGVTLSSEPGELGWYRS
jgi:hypothetical protein